jgi:hypothetical protein
MSATHSDLVELAKRWLQSKCGVVITEIATTGEEPDAIGWQGSHSLLIECKASRADFLADKQKSFRRQSERGIGLARYFLAPAGMIAVDELPEKWGLLETNDGQRAQVVKASSHFADTNHRHEITILLSAMRRLGQTQPTGCSIRFYTIESKNRATLGVDVEANT